MNSLIHIFVVVDGFFVILGMSFTIKKHPNPQSLDPRWGVEGDKWTMSPTKKTSLFLKIPKRKWQRQRGSASEVAEVRVTCAIRFISGHFLWRDGERLLRKKKVAVHEKADDIYFLSLFLWCMVHVAVCVVLRYWKWWYWKYRERRVGGSNVVWRIQRGVLSRDCIHRYRCRGFPIFQNVVLKVKTTESQASRML